MPKDSDDELPDNVKMIKDEEYIQEGKITLAVPNLEEVRGAIAVLSVLRKQALEDMGVDLDDEEEGTVVLSVDYEIVGNSVIAHVTQGMVD